MKKGIKQTIFYTGIVTFICCVQLVYAQPYGYGFEKVQKHGEKAFGKITQELNLTTEQQGLLQQQRTQQKEKIKKLREELKGERIKLKAELENYDTNEKSLKEVMARIKALQNELMDQRIEGILAMKKILTPEQFKTLQEKRKEKKAKRKKFFRRKFKERHELQGEGVDE